jgi:hypothetical protein
LKGGAKKYEIEGIPINFDHNDFGNLPKRIMRKFQPQGYMANEHGAGHEGI